MDGATEYYRIFGKWGRYIDTFNRYTKKRTTAVIFALLPLILPNPAQHLITNYKKESEIDPLTVDFVRNEIEQREEGRIRYYPYEIRQIPGDLGYGVTSKTPLTMLYQYYRIRLPFTTETSWHTLWIPEGLTRRVHATIRENNGLLPINFEQVDPALRTTSNIPNYTPHEYYSHNFSPDENPTFTSLTNSEYKPTTVSTNTAANWWDRLFVKNCFKPVDEKASAAEALVLDRFALRHERVHMGVGGELATRVVLSFGVYWVFIMMRRSFGMVSGTSAIMLAAFYGMARQKKAAMEEMADLRAARIMPLSDKNKVCEWFRRSSEREISVYGLQEFNTIFQNFLFRIGLYCDYRLRIKMLESWPMKVKIKARE
eukprot:TRINITY_DN8278_c0_g1_i1.p1 TRINITY_DN8278_c0_g1~~TRINITY_DN8278_c0_g1_i1.p1  ORF type:complete len:371 (+),score=12.66 TRINITY_DN8278_c0_g1_i1:63-1175(+)